MDIYRKLQKKKSYKIIVFLFFLFFFFSCFSFFLVFQQYPFQRTGYLCFFLFSSIPLSKDGLPMFFLVFINTPFKGRVTYVFTCFHQSPLRWARTVTLLPCALRRWCCATNRPPLVAMSSLTHCSSLARIAAA